MRRSNSSQSDCANEVPVAKQRRPKVVVAEEFLLIDKDGKRRGTWSTTLYKHPAFCLYDEDELERVMVLVSENGSPSIGLLNKAGHPIVGIGQTPDGRIGLQVSDKSGVQRVSIDIDAGDAAAITITDQNGNVVWQSQPS
jgi:hypothetical protein